MIRERPKFPLEHLSTHARRDPHCIGCRVGGDFKTSGLLAPTHHLGIALGDPLAKKGVRSLHHAGSSCFALRMATGATVCANFIVLLHRTSRNESVVVLGADFAPWRCLCQMEELLPPDNSGTCFSHWEFKPPTYACSNLYCAVRLRSCRGPFSAQPSPAQPSSVPCYLKEYIRIRSPSMVPWTYDPYGGRTQRLTHHCVVGKDSGISVVCCSCVGTMQGSL
jgi:hypothetical protein